VKSCEKKETRNVGKREMGAAPRQRAPVHSSLVIRDFRTKNAMTVIPQPPFSPDLAPADFFLFPKMKRPMKPDRFDDVEAIKKKSLEELKSIPEEDFQRAFGIIQFFFLC